MTDKIRVLVVSKGHAYNHDSFLAMLDSMDDIDATLVQHLGKVMILWRPRPKEEAATALPTDKRQRIAPSRASTVRT